MAQSQDTDDALLAEISDNDGFNESVLKEVRDKISSNFTDASNMGMDPSMSVDEVLSIDNISDVDVRAKPLENPRVTFWLKDCPTWANDAWNDTIYPRGLNAYNGKTRVVFDVRPF